MLKIKGIVAFCLMTYLLIATENQPFKQSSSQGRYQMQVISSKSGGNIRVFLLEIETGMIWVSHANFDGDYSGWTALPQLPSFSSFSIY